MKLTVCAVRDRAIDTYANPFFVRALGEAIRSFTDEVNRAAQDNQLYQHPEDFDLYELGIYDNEDGTFISNGPRMICIGKEVAIRS